MEVCGRVRVEERSGVCGLFLEVLRVRTAKTIRWLQSGMGEIISPVLNVIRNIKL